MDNAQCSYSHLAPPANYPPIILSSKYPNILFRMFHLVPHSFDGNLPNLSSFPRYNSFSMWPWKLFENSIQLHRIENWLKSWRPGESGGDSYIYDWPAARLQTDKQEKLPNMNFGSLISVQSCQCQFLALSEEYSLFTPVLDICSDLPSATHPNTTKKTKTDGSQKAIS